MTMRSKVAVLAAEFLGTAILATVAINISRSQIGIGYFVAIGVGIALGMLVLAFGSISGGHFNPAITIGLWTVRQVKTVTAISYLAVQMLGGLAAWQLANYFIGSELQSVANAEFDWKILVAEAVGAMVFALFVATAVFKKHEGGKQAALIGGGLTVGVIVASLASNAIINPAIALANQSWSWAYVAGPILGALIGMNLYVLLFAPISSLGLPKRLTQPKAAPVVVSKKSTTTTKPATKKAPAKKTTTRKKK